MNAERDAAELRAVGRVRATLPGLGATAHGGGERPKVPGGGNIDAAWAAGPRVRIGSLAAGERFIERHGFRGRVGSPANDGGVHVHHDVGGHDVADAGVLVVRETVADTSASEATQRERDDGNARAQTALCESIYRRRAHAMTRADSLRVDALEEREAGERFLDFSVESERFETLAAAVFDDKTWHAVANLRQRVMLERDPAIAGDFSTDGEEVTMRPGTDAADDGGRGKAG